jgi:hypothetical protein
MGDVFFSVDPDGLDRLQAQLGALRETMQNSGNVAVSFEPLDLGPDQNVWNALQGFHDNWSNGLAMIGHNISALVGLLAKAAADYRGTDEQIAQAAQPTQGSGR